MKESVQLPATVVMMSELHNILHNGVLAIPVQLLVSDGESIEGSQETSPPSSKVMAAL